MTGKEEREARLAARLRDNLKKRKVARATPPPVPPEPKGEAK
jgi:hypothetical protein